MSALPIAVSMGDPSGIGPDIIVRAWQENSGSGALPDFFVVGNRHCLEARAKALGAGIQIGAYDSSQPHCLRVMDTGHTVVAKPGQPEVSDAPATVAAIDTAVGLVVSETASSVVTCPINKDILYKADFKHPGHTEYLGALALQHTGREVTPVMMLAGPELRTVPVTIHIALCEVQNALTEALIVETATITARDLRERFGIEHPRIAIAGLNPHAGENGAMGREEIETIIPAIETLRTKGIDVRGPLPADTMFHAGARQKYDVALCMYHDQALIPAKMLGFDDAVNVTLGLPFIRTSPDHGTAYDIAGTGIANPSSFVAALKMAAEMAASS